MVKKVLAQRGEDQKGPQFMQGPTWATGATPVDHWDGCPPEVLKKLGRCRPR